MARAAASPNGHAGRGRLTREEIKPHLAEGRLKYTPDTMRAPAIDPSLARAMSLFLAVQAERVYQQHRLAYVFDKEGEELYVCLCDEAYSKHNFNLHIRDKYKEVA